MPRFHIAKYKVEAFSNHRIVVLSDIHYYNKKMVPLLNKIVVKVEKWKPDFICLPGDFIDESEIYDEEYFLSFLSSLKEMAPVILSIGNHEVKKKHIKLDKMNQKIFDKIRSIPNVYLMDNSSLEMGNLRFTCLTFPTISYNENQEGYEKTLENLSNHYPDGLKKDKFNVVLSHSPFTLLHQEVKKTKFYASSNLILSGHTHGGLTPAWIANLTHHVLITPQQHLFPKNSYGYLKCEKTIVSSGITKLSHFNPFRYFNFLFSSEIVVIDLKKEAND